MFKHTLNLNSWNVLCLFPTKFSKIWFQIFSCQNRKSELSIDGLIISVPLLTFGVRKRKNFVVKSVKKCTLRALLNFASLLYVLFYYFQNLLIFYLFVKTFLYFENLIKSWFEKYFLSKKKWVNALFFIKEMNVLN